METVCKYPDWTRGQVEALLNVIGEENARKLIAGDLTVEFREILKSLFDKNGRRIPEGLEGKVVDPDREFYFDQPLLNQESDFASRIEKLHRCLEIDTEITAKQLMDETKRLRGFINKRSQIVNILKAVYLPIVMPRISANLGAELERYLNGVDKSYTSTFRGRRFINYRKNGLSNQVHIVNNSRHDQLISRMKEGPVIGLHFPNPLQGFSVNADREQMTTLPEGLILSGMDTPIAMVMYPDVLARDWHTPGMFLAALSWRSVGYSLGFTAFTGSLHFGAAVHLALAYDYYSGAFLFLG